MSRARTNAFDDDVTRAIANAVHGRIFALGDADANDRSTRIDSMKALVRDIIDDSHAIEDDDDDDGDDDGGDDDESAHACDVIDVDRALALGERRGVSASDARAATDCARSATTIARLSQCERAMKFKAKEEGEAMSARGEDDGRTKGNANEHGWGARARRAIERLRGDATSAMSASEVLEHARAEAERARKVLPKNHFHRVLRSEAWTEGQREAIERVERALREEYVMRRKMVARRAQVTTTSFCFSSRLNALKDVREEFARRVDQDLRVEPNVTMDDVRDARYADLATAGIKVTAGRGALNSAVKKVMIGAVPDRGGRTDVNDRALMPTFTTRKEAPDPGASGSGDKAVKDKKKGYKRW